MLILFRYNSNHVQYQIIFLIHDSVQVIFQDLDMDPKFEKLDTGYSKN